MVPKHAPGEAGRYPFRARRDWSCRQLTPELTPKEAKNFWLGRRSLLTYIRTRSISGVRDELLMSFRPNNLREVKHEDDLFENRVLFRSPGFRLGLIQFARSPGKPIEGHRKGDNCDRLPTERRRSRRILNHVGGWEAIRPPEQDRKPIQACRSQGHRNGNAGP